MLLLGGFKISKNFALDYLLLHQVRSFKDGITFFELKKNLDLYKSDHKPSFDFSLS